VDWLYRIFGQPAFSNTSSPSRMGQLMAEMGLLPQSGQVMPTHAMNLPSVEELR
jgi:hypothetical protein